jgi:hypothetical protein
MDLAAEFRVRQVSYLPESGCIPPLAEIVSSKHKPERRAVSLPPAKTACRGCAHSSPNRLVTLALSHWSLGQPVSDLSVDRGLYRVTKGIDPTKGNVAEPGPGNGARPVSSWRLMINPNSGVEVAGQ